jgi:23S rRNA pseudouridine1911/1915/1917 synthase
LQKKTSTSSQKLRRAETLQGSFGRIAETSFAVTAASRVDRAVADELGCGRRAVRELIRAGRVLVKGRKASAATHVEAGVTITVLPADAEATAAALATRLLWEDVELRVLDKPAGTHTHAGRSSPSVAAQLLHDHPELASLGRRGIEAGLAHRLDCHTSGLLLAASTTDSYARLRADFAAHRIAKHYLALVAGTLDASFATDAALARRATRVVAARGRDRLLRARSHVTPMEVGRSWSLVEIATSTGAPHQVRVHLALAGHPILGDDKYGGPPAPPGTRDGQLLHARRVVLRDGRSFTAAAPEDFLRALWSLRRDSPA